MVTQRKMWGREHARGSPGELPAQIRVGWRTVSPAEKQNTVVVQRGAAASVKG